MAKIFFGSFGLGTARQVTIDHIAGLLTSAGHVVDAHTISPSNPFVAADWGVTDHDVVVWFYFSGNSVYRLQAADFFQTYNVPKIWFDCNQSITSKYTTKPQVVENTPAPGHSLIWWLNSSTPMTIGLGGNGYPFPETSGGVPFNVTSSIVAEAPYWDIRAHLAQGDYALLNAFDSGDTVGSLVVPHRTVLYAVSLGFIGSDVGSLNQGYVDCLLKSIDWALEGSTTVLGNGGIVLGGSATAAQVAQLPLGGLRFLGSATTLKVAAGQVLVEFTASGRLLFAGRATTSRVSVDIRENERWSNVDDGLEEIFLYGRLFNQRSPFVARDSGPHIIGNLLQGLAAENYTLSYNPVNGEFSINGEVHFTKTGAVKVDFTFDDRGFPIIAYELDEAIWLYRWNHSLQDYEDVVIGAGTQPFICFYGTRINSTGEPVLIYLRGSQVVTRRGSENFERLYATSAVLPDNVRVRISGLGQTPTDRLQANLRAIYERKVE